MLFLLVAVNNVFLKKNTILMSDYNATNQFTIFFLQLKWYIVTSYMTSYMSFTTLSLTPYDKKKNVKITNYFTNC